MNSNSDTRYPEPPYTRVMGPIVEKGLIRLDHLRTEAVQKLELRQGDRVIDAGCGNGANFPFLLEQVGITGEVVGVEISPLLAEMARQHIQANGWENVHVVESPAQTTVLNREFDALLLFAVHEILTSAAALDNLFPYLKTGGRIVTFGARLIKPPLGWITNAFFRRISKKWLPNSPAIDAQPWRLLNERLDQIKVERRVGGLMYLVSGRKKG